MPTESGTLVPFVPLGAILESALGTKALEMALSGRSPATMRGYGDDLKNFALWRSQEVGQAVAALLAMDPGMANGEVYAYRAFLLNRKLAPATVNRRLAALRTLVQMARQVGMITWSLEVPGVKSEVLKDTRGPGVPAIRKLLKAAAGQKKGAKAARDVAILRLLFDLALRRAELVALDVGDVEKDGGGLWVMRKGRREKLRLSLPEVTWKAVGGWMEERGGEPGALFLSFDRAEKGDGRLSGQGLYRLLQWLGEKAGVESLRPHGIRHTAITAALEEAGRSGTPIEEVLAYSGHSRQSLSLLLRYRDNLGDKQGEIARKVAGRAGTPD